jgi:hypothetical protein
MRVVKQNIVQVFQLCVRIESDILFRHLSGLNFIPELLHPPIA